MYYDNYAKENIGKSRDVLYYIDTTLYTTVESQKALLDEIYSTLEPGDLITYRHGQTSGSSGHVMIYVGGGMFLHCTGSSYSYNTDPSKSHDNATTVERTQGAINLLNASEVFTNTSSSRYLFKKTSSDSVWTFSLIRPLYRSGLKVKDEALARLELLYASIEKTSDKHFMESVGLGEEITYYITIKNNSKVSYDNVNVIDNLSSYVSVVSDSISDSGSLNGAKISWVISVTAGSTVTLSYKVKVNNDNSLIGKKIDASSCTVNGIKTNDLYFYVSSLSSANSDALITKANSLVGTSYSESLLLMKDIYSAINKTFTSYTKSSEVISEVLPSGKINQTGATGAIVLPDNWGGLATTDAYLTNNHKVRLVTSTYLEAGDIIVIYNSNNKSYQSFMFLSYDKVIGLKDGQAQIIYSGRDNVASFLETLISYNKFVIIRPSLAN